MRIIKISQRKYPRYVSEMREGRLKGQSPMEIRMVPNLRKEWDSGGFGTGSRLIEFEADSPAGLIHKLMDEGISPQYDDVEFYEIRGPNSPRVRIPRQRLFEMAHRPPTAG